MQKILTAIIATVLMSSCQALKPTPPPEADVVIDRLMEIEAQVKTGVSRSEYSQSITKLQLAVDKFKDTEFSKKRPSLTAFFEKTLLDQKIAIAAWEECKKDPDMGALNAKGYCWEGNTLSFKAIFIRYPEIQEDTTIRQSDKTNAGYFYSGDAIVQKLWTKTTEDIPKIKQLLKE